MKIFTRYELITDIIQANYLLESDREMIAKSPDSVILRVYGMQHFKELRKGYYTLN